VLGEVERKRSVDEAVPQLLLLMETFDLEFSHWVKFNLKTNETIKEGNPIDDGAGKGKVEVEKPENKKPDNQQKVLNFDDIAEFVKLTFIDNDGPKPKTEQANEGSKKEGGINENRDAGNEGQEGSEKAGEQEVNQELDYLPENVKEN
jgi:hypothetical protein